MGYFIIPCSIDVCVSVYVLRLIHFEIQSSGVPGREREKRLIDLLSTDSFARLP